MKSQALGSSACSALRAAVISRHTFETLARSTNAIEVAERFADGAATQSDLSAAWDLAGAVGPELSRTRGVHAAKAMDAADAAMFTAGDDVRTFARTVVICAANAMFGTVDTMKAERSSQADLLRDVFGNPSRSVTISPAWQSGNVLDITQRIYDERRFIDMPILADALEDAGCTDRAILDHCRQPGEHVRGCWVVDLVLGKA